MRGPGRQLAAHASRPRCLAPLHQLVLELAGGADQQLEELAGEVLGQADGGAAGEVARPHLGDPLGLHHRDPVLALVVGDFAADLEALAKQARDLLIDRVEPVAEPAEAVVAHDDLPLRVSPIDVERSSRGGASQQAGGEGLGALGEEVERVAALLDHADGQARLGASRAPMLGEDLRLEVPGAVRIAGDDVVAERDDQSAASKSSQRFAEAGRQPVEVGRGVGDCRGTRPPPRARSPARPCRRRRW